VVGFIRDPTDEQKALFVAVVVMMIADRALWWIDFPFVVRTTAAVGVGFIGLFIASYLLTGQFVPRTRTLTTTSARSTSTRWTLNRLADRSIPAYRSRPVDPVLSILACRSRPVDPSPRRRSKPFIPAPPEVAGMPRAEAGSRTTGGQLRHDGQLSCKINHYSTAKPGKHGSAKARVEGQGCLRRRKRSLSQPVDAKVWVPIIQRKQGQVVSVSGDDAQVMDLDTYETFTMRIPEGEDFTSDDNIEYLEYEGQRKVVG